MSKNSLAISSKDGLMEDEPNIIHAAENGDLNEGLAALREDPECIFETHLHTGMNALQVALSQWQYEFVRFITSNTEISSHHKDKFGRDSLDIALEFICEENIVNHD